MGESSCTASVEAKIHKRRNILSPPASQGTRRSQSASLPAAVFISAKAAAAMPGMMQDLLIPGAAREHKLPAGKELSSSEQSSWLSPIALGHAAAETGGADRLAWHDGRPPQ
jgi:hypothetical protein